MSLNSLRFEALTPGVKSLGSFAKGHSPEGSQTSRNQQTELAAWYEEANEYYSSVMNGKIPRPSEAEMRQLDEWMRWAHEQLMPGWNPVSDFGFNPVPSGIEKEELLPNGAKIGPRQNIYWDEKKAEIPFEARGKIEDVWSDDITITVPSMAVQLNSAEITTDTRFQPPQQVFKIVLKDRISGQEEVYMINDYLNATVKIKMPEGNVLDPKILEAADKIKPGLIVQDKLSAEGEALPTELGTPPSNRKEGNTLYWDEAVDGSSLNSVELTPTVGTEELDVSTDNLNIKIKNRSWKVKVEKTDKHEYTVLIEDRSGRPVRTIHAHGIDAINIEGADEHNVLFKDAKADPQSESKAWDEAHAPDAQLTVNGKAEGDSQTNPTGADQRVNPNAAGDTAADRVEGDTAYYNNLKNEVVELTPYYGEDAKVKKYDITANEFKLGKGMFGDTIKITKNPNENFYTIVSGPAGKEQTFIVRAQKIAIEPSDAKIIYNGKDYFSGMDPQIKVEGEAKLPKVIEQLSQVTGKNPGEILDLFKEMKDSFPGIMGYDGRVTLETIENASKLGDFPPAQPNHELILFFFKLDPQFKAKLKAVRDALTNRTDASAPMRQASQRLVALLNGAYNIDPANGNRITIGLDEPSATQWERLNDIRFNGREFDYTIESGFEQTWDRGESGVLGFRFL